MCAKRLTLGLLPTARKLARWEYIHTLQLVDIASRWSERVAVFGRSQAAMVEAFRRLQTQLPFHITHLHPDI